MYIAASCGVLVKELRMIYTRKKDETKDDLEKYDKIAKDFEKKCFIIGHFFVEINKNGSIRKLRDKIRRKGITFKQ